VTGTTSDPRDTGRQPVISPAAAEADELEAHRPEEYLAHLEVRAGSPTPEDLSAIAVALSVAERERHREQRRRAEQVHEPDPAWRERERVARRDRQLY
jgi:hypothetical protein